MSKLDIGSGPIYRKGFTRMDFDKNVRPDILWDLNKFPWPIDNDSYDRVESHHTIEHLPEISPFLREVTRIAKDGSTYRFEFPHYSVAFIEPGHRRGYGLHALSYHKQFVNDLIRLEWSPDRKNKGILFKIMDKTFTFFGNLSPYKTERIWCYWVGGFSNVVLEGHIDKSKMTNKWFQHDEV